MLAGADGFNMDFIKAERSEEPKRAVISGDITTIWKLEEARSSKLSGWYLTAFAE